MKIATRLLFVVLGLSIASVACAQRQTFTVNPDASQLSGSHRVNGTFHVQSGSVSFDPGTQSISGLIVAAAGSGNSGEASRDKKMDSEVLNTDQYTEITFAPKSYQGTLAPTGDSNIQVTGVFTLHGTPHEITVPMQIHIEGGSCWPKANSLSPM